MQGYIMETNLVVEGVKFMLLGMGAVFLFLALMIVCMNILAAVTHKYFPEPRREESSTPKSTNQNDQKKIVAAITAAIMHHRQS